MKSGWRASWPPFFTTASFHRFRLTVDPKKPATLTVAEVHPVSTRWELNNLSEKEIGYFVDGQMISPMWSAPCVVS